MQHQNVRALLLVQRLFIVAARPVRAGVEGADILDERVLVFVAEDGVRIGEVDAALPVRVQRIEIGGVDVPSGYIVVVVYVGIIDGVLELVRIVLFVEAVIVHIIFVCVIEAAPVEGAVFGIVFVRFPAHLVEHGTARRVDDAGLCGRGAGAHAAVVGDRGARPTVRAADHIAAVAVRKVLEVRIGKSLRIRAGLARAFVLLVVRRACAQSEQPEREHHEDAQHQGNDPQLCGFVAFSHRTPFALRNRNYNLFKSYYLILI